MGGTIGNTYDIEFDDANRSSLGAGSVIIYLDGEEIGEIEFKTFQFLAGLLVGLDFAKFRPVEGDDGGSRMANFRKLLMELHGNG